MKTGTNVVLIYDTDIDKTDILDKNINQLKSSKHIKRIICIPQVLNLEDELVSATSVRQVIEILGSRTLTDYKRILIFQSSGARSLLRVFQNTEMMRI